MMMLQILMLLVSIKIILSYNSTNGNEVVYFDQSVSGQLYFQDSVYDASNNMLYLAGYNGSAKLFNAAAFMMKYDLGSMSQVCNLSWLLEGSTQTVINAITLTSTGDIVAVGQAIIKPVSSFQYKYYAAKIMTNGCVRDHEIQDQYSTNSPLFESFNDVVRVQNDYYVVGVIGNPSDYSLSDFVLSSKNPNIQQYSIITKLNDNLELQWRKVFQNQEIPKQFCSTFQNQCGSVSNEIALFKGQLWISSIDYSAQSSTFSINYYQNFYYSRFSLSGNFTAYNSSFQPQNLVDINIGYLYRPGSFLFSTDNEILYLGQDQYIRSSTSTIPKYYSIIEYYNSTSNSIQLFNNSYSSFSDYGISSNLRLNNSTYCFVIQQVNTINTDQQAIQVACQDQSTKNQTYYQTSSFENNIQGIFLNQQLTLDNNKSSFIYIQSSERNSFMQIVQPDGSPTNFTQLAFQPSPSISQSSASASTQSSTSTTTLSTSSTMTSSQLTTTTTTFSSSLFNTSSSKTDPLVTLPFSIMPSNTKLLTSLNQQLTPVTNSTLASIDSTSKIDATTEMSSSDSSTDLISSPSVRQSSTQQFDSINLSGQFGSTQLKPSAAFSFSGPENSQKQSESSTQSFNSDNSQQSGSNQLAINQNLLYGIIGAILFVILFIAGMLFYRKVRRGKKPLVYLHQNDTHYDMNQTIPLGIQTSLIHGNAQNLTTVFDAKGLMSTFMAGATTMFAADREVSIPGYLKYIYLIDFKPRQLIGSGGGGSIYYCDLVNQELRQSAMDQRMVVKVIKNATNDPQSMAVFFQELALLWFFRDNPFIANIYGYSDAPPSIIMKFYEHGSLMDLLRKKSKANQFFNIEKPSTWIRILFDVSIGLLSLHQSGIVHNDIKCANILLDIDTNGVLRAVLTDFGLAKIVDPSTMLVKSFQIPQIKGGSLVYAAPEVFKRLKTPGFSEDISAAEMTAVDIYSLSIVLLEVMIRKQAWRKYKN